MDSDIGATFVATFVARRLLMDEVYGFKKCTFGVYGAKWHKLQVYAQKNALSEFMDLTDTNYKLIDLKMHF